MDAVEERHQWMVSLLRTFGDRHGLSALRQETVVRLGASWGPAYRCRTPYRDGELPHWLVEQLEAIDGWHWEKLTLAESQSSTWTRRGSAAGRNTATSVPAATPRA